MEKNTTENLAMTTLVLAIMIDLGLLVYYLTLSSDNIDAMWNFPFIGTWFAAFCALLSLLAFGVYIKPRSKGFVSTSVVALVIAVSLEVLTRSHLFLW